MFWNKKTEPVISVEVHRSIVNALEESLQSTKENIDKVIDNAKTIETERDELKELVREQTEADLLLTSIKIEEKIKKGKTMEDTGLASLAARQRGLLDQQQQLRSYATHPTSGFIGQSIGAPIYYQRY